MNKMSLIEDDKTLESCITTKKQLPPSGDLFFFLGAGVEPGGKMDGTQKSNQSAVRLSR